MRLERNLEDIVETIRNAKDRDKKALLFVGAGCSVTAGIPPAGKIVDEINTKFPMACKRAGKNDYSACMRELNMDERRTLINEHINRARINWAHIAMAQLIKHGYVDRVLTTNFDPLVVKACALVGVFPAIYDFASSPAYIQAAVADQAVFYLQGQYNGFFQNHTPEQTKSVEVVGRAIQSEGENRPFIVAGYSGENDPLLEHMGKIAVFNSSLYWVCYKDSEPAELVNEKIICDGKYAFKVKGFDADSFFISLAQKLGCFPPDFVKTPFTHLMKQLDTLCPSYTHPGQDRPIQPLDTPRQDIEAAIVRFESGGTAETTAKETTRQVYSALIKKANAAYMADEHEKVIELVSDEDAKQDPELANMKAWSLIELGNNDYNNAITVKGEEADRLLDAACKKYEAALKIKPDMHEALNNWGAALHEQAKTKSGKEADSLFKAAFVKYESALKIKPDYHLALNNWGAALHEQAKTKSGEEADSLFKAAFAKYESALKIKPDMHEALNNWGFGLAEQAKTKSGEEADRLLEEACEKYDAALKIKPDMHDALNNWGNALAEQAKTKSGEEADSLFKAACEKYEAALKIKPDDHEALYNWGNALDDQAQTKSGDEADRLFKAAFVKYESALKIKPDYHEALNNWGLALANQAYNRPENEREKYYLSAREKCMKAEELKPGKGAYNLACISALMGEQEECLSWLKKSKEHGYLPKKSHIEGDRDFDAVKDTEWFKDFLAELD